MTAEELSEELSEITYTAIGKITGKTRKIKFVERMLRHYRKNGLLRRKKNWNNKYVYHITKRGLERLEFIIEEEKERNKIKQPEPSFISPYVIAVREQTKEMLRENLEKRFGTCPINIGGKN